MIPDLIDTVEQMLPTIQDALFGETAPGDHAKIVLKWGQHRGRSALEDVPSAGAFPKLTGKVGIRQRGTTTADL